MPRTRRLRAPRREGTAPSFLLLINHEISKEERPIARSTPLALGLSDFWWFSRKWYQSEVLEKEWEAGGGGRWNGAGAGSRGQRRQKSRAVRERAGTRSNVRERRRRVEHRRERYQQGEEPRRRRALVWRVVAPAPGAAARRREAECGTRRNGLTRRGGSLCVASTERM